MSGYEELKLFDLSGLEGNGWIEKINSENPRLVDFVVRTSLGELIKNGIASFDFLTFSASTTAPPNATMEMPFVIKIPIKIYGVKTLNRMKAYEFLEMNFLPSSPLVLPSIITLQKASTDSILSSEAQKDKEKKGRPELGFKILSEKCRKTRLHLVRLFFRKRPFEEIIDKKGDNGFVPRIRKAVDVSSKGKFLATNRRLQIQQIQQHLSPERRKVFIRPKKTPKTPSSNKKTTASSSASTTTTGLLPPSPTTTYHRVDSSLSPRKCISGNKQVYSPSLEVSPSFSKISHYTTSTTITSSSSAAAEAPVSKKRLRRIPPLKHLPPLRIGR